MCLPLTTRAINITSNIPFHYEEVDDELVLYQLQKILALAYNLEINEKEIFFRYKGNDYHLYGNNKHLVLSPGSQIFFEEIDDYYFKAVDGVLKVVISRKDKEVEIVLSKEESFYITDFSQSDVAYEHDDNINY